MDTNSLIEIAKKKLEEIKIKQKEDGKKLEQLINQRGELLASEIVGDIKKEDVEEIKKLSAEIDALKVEIIEGGVPLVTALKNKIVILEKQKKDEELKEANSEQDKLEKKMHEVSMKLIPPLEKVVKLNSQLRRYWSSWSELSEKTERQTAKLKVSLGSETMLNFSSQTIINEWKKGEPRKRRFYNRIAL